MPQSQDDRTAHRSPSRGAGHYAAGGAAWFDEPTGRSYPLLSERESLEIRLEEVGARSWWTRILTTLGSQYGSQLLRFVAHVRSEGDRPGLVDGPTFSSPRGVSDQPPEPAWAPEMNGALSELRLGLEREGWLPEGRGAEPWAFRYARALVDWEHPTATS